MRYLVMSFILVSLFLICLSAAEAADWKLISESEDGNMSLSVDEESIQVSSNGLMRAWLKLANKEPEHVESKRISSYLDYREFNCAERRARSLKTIYYYTDGTNESSDEDQWLYVTPDSVQDGIYGYVCKKVKK
jgi:hypothetical protein